MQKGAAMQSKSTFTDDIANLFTNALGAAKGVGDELKAVARSRTDQVIAEMDLIGREEFEVLKERLDNLAAENAELKKQIAALKPKRASAKKTAAKK